MSFNINSKNKTQRRGTMFQTGGGKGISTYSANILALCSRGKSVNGQLGYSEQNVTQRLRGWSSPLEDSRFLLGR